MRAKNRLWLQMPYIKVYIQFSGHGAFLVYLSSCKAFKRLESQIKKTSFRSKYSQNLLRLSMPEED